MVPSLLRLVADFLVEAVGAAVAAAAAAAALAAADNFGVDVAAVAAAAAFTGVDFGAGVDFVCAAADVDGPAAVLLTVAELVVADLASVRRGVLSSNVSMSSLTPRYRSAAVDSNSSNSPWIASNSSVGSCSVDGRVRALVYVGKYF